MDIIICVKQALDSTQDIRLTEEGRIYEKGLSYVLNDWDNYALEEALLTKEKLSGSLTAITVGPERADQVLKECLAKGADKAIRIWDRAIEGSDGHALAGILCEVIKRMKYDLILAGAQAEDDGCAHVGPAIAQILGIHHATMITKIRIQSGKTRVHRELEGGFEEVLEVDLPAVFTIQTGINKPRYPSLKGIKRAMKEEVKMMGLKDIGLCSDDVGEAGSATRVEQLYLPQIERFAEILEGEPDETAAALSHILKDRGYI